MSNRPEFEGEQFEKGLQIRREVLGDAYVDRSIAAADDVSAPLQKLLTEWCWGEIWSRPGLERRMRSVLNLGMIMALNRSAEFKTPRPRRTQQRRDQGRNSGDHSAGRNLLRRTRVTGCHESGADGFCGCRCRE